LSLIGRNSCRQPERVVDAGQNADYEIVGVVADTLYQVGQLSKATMYFPVLNGGSSAPGLTLTVLTASDRLALSVPIQKLIAELDPELPVSDVFTMQQIIARSVGNASLSASLTAAPEKGAILAVRKGPAEWLCDGQLRAQRDGA
jgi:hypothetical protein